MIKIIKNLKIPIKNEKGMELIQIFGLIAIALILAAALMHTAQRQLGEQVGSVGEEIVSIYDFVEFPEAEKPVEDVASMAYDSQRLGGLLAEFYGKAENTISEYTHLKSGTIHHLTGKGNNIKFKTTAKWNRGDSLLINGKEARIYNYTGARLEKTEIFASSVIVNMSIMYVESQDIYICYL